MLTICFSALPAQAKYGGGTGEPNDPYLIFDANQMNAIGADANDWDKHFKLMADIDLSSFTGTDFNIIGTFTGVFDGNGKTISNFTYSSTATNYIGLFGCIRGAEITDFGLIDPNIVAPAGNYVGSLVGRLIYGTISGCYLESGSVSGENGVGGLVGKNCGYGGVWGTIANCYASGEISGNYYVGGLVGWNSLNGTITNSYSTGSVSGYADVGSLAGFNHTGTITNCYSTGNVSGRNHMGGLVGQNYHKGTITNCYSTSSVTGTGWGVGGLVGYTESGTISASFWDIETSGQTTSDGGTGKTTAEMQTLSTFTDVGWDFVGEYENGPSDDWAQPSGVGYPILWWQLSPLPALPSFSGGTGEPNDPYLISRSSDLNRIGHNPRLMAAHFKLINDIDLTGVDFFIIGSKPFPFAGVFDGDGYTISNFTYLSKDTDYIGLFGCVDDSNAEIKNLRLIDPNIDVAKGWYFGSLVGQLSGGTVTGCYVEGGGLVGTNYGIITNCYATGSVSGTTYVGGLVGINAGVITDCYSSGNVSGTTKVGGLVGQNGGWLKGYLIGGTITNCYSTSSVSGNESVGGLVGINEEGIITNCYSVGDVSGDTRVGGLVGKNHGPLVTVTNCYATGSVSGTMDVGGLVGIGLARVTDSFWDIETSEQTTSAGGIGKTTAEMQTQSTFTDAGWDFSTPIWKMNCEGMSYPKLSWWQLVLGDFGCPDGVEMRDFAILAAQWQQPPGEPSADIAPDGGNGIVDWFDLAALVENWLAGF